MPLRQGAACPLLLLLGLYLCCLRGASVALVSPRELESAFVLRGGLAFGRDELGRGLVDLNAAVVFWLQVVRLAHVSGVDLSVCAGLGVLFLQCLALSGTLEGQLAFALSAAVLVRVRIVVIVLNIYERYHHQSNRGADHLRPVCLCRAMLCRRHCGPL